MHGTERTNGADATNNSKVEGNTTDETERRQDTARVDIMTVPLGMLTDHVSMPDRAQSVSAPHDEVALTSAVATFEQFYESNIDGLARALTATLGDPNLAQDAAQEAMLRACSKWAKISSYDNPFGWTFRVGLNWATSRWRRRKREDLTGSINPAALMSENATIDPGIAQAVLALPVDWRAVIVLRIWMDWSIEDTAAALEIPKGTVRSRMTRAVKHLRTVLDDRDVQMATASTNTTNNPTTQNPAIESTTTTTAKDAHNA